VAILASAVSSSQTARTVFVVEVDGNTDHKSFGYLCGACGASLSDHATVEVLECVFICSVCDVANESPMEARTVFRKADRS
jgi:hypothetical protein